MPRLVPTSWLAPTYTTTWVIPQRLESWPFLPSTSESLFLGCWTQTFRSWPWEWSLRWTPLSHSDVHPQVSLEETGGWQVVFPGPVQIYKAFFPSISIQTLRFSPSLRTSRTKAEASLRPLQKHKTTSLICTPGGSAKLPMSPLDYYKLNFRVS